MTLPMEKKMNYGKIRSYQDLDIWKRSMNIAEMAYKLTKKFPYDERYNMVSQIKRSADSIPANIAEGFIRQSNKEKVRFYNISQGSLEECRNYLILSRDLKYGDPSILMENLDEISRILRSYIHSIEINSSSTLNEPEEGYSTNY